MNIDESGNTVFHVGDKVMVNFDVYPKQHVSEIEEFRDQVGSVTRSKDVPYENSHVSPLFYEVYFGDKKVYLTNEEMIPVV